MNAIWCQTIDTESRNSRTSESKLSSTVLSRPVFVQMVNLVCFQVPSSEIPKLVNFLTFLKPIYNFYVCLLRL